MKLEYKKHLKTISSWKLASADFLFYKNLEILESFKDDDYSALHVDLHIAGVQQACTRAEIALQRSFDKT